MGNILTRERQIEVLGWLADGASISATSRQTRTHRDTCTGLLVRFGEACRRFLDREMHDLEFSHGADVGHLEIDELWTYCRKKKKNVTGEEPDLDEIGEFYLFVALDQETRLIPVFRLDRRDATTATSFMCDLASRLKFPKPHASDAHNYEKERYKPIIRISTDAFPPYPEAIDFAFGPYAQYAQIVKDVRKDGVSINKRVFRGKVNEKADLDFVGGAEQSDGPQLHATAYSAHHLLQQEVAKPAGSHRHLHGALQLLPQESDSEDDAGSAGGTRRQNLVIR